MLQGYEERNLNMASVTSKYIYSVNSVDWLKLAKVHLICSFLANSFYC